MTANITRKRKLNKEEKAELKAILGKMTKTELHQTGNISWATVIEATTSYKATEATVEKIHKVYLELENPNTLYDLLIDIRDLELGLVSINAGQQLLYPDSMKLTWLRILRDDLAKQPISDVTKQYGKTIYNKIMNLK